MRIFRKIIINSIAFLLIVTSLSFLIVEPMIQNESDYYIDGKVRERLAGNIDFIYLGDSDGLTAFIPSVFDEKTGYSSYNLSGSMITGESEWFLLEKEIERNPVKTVVLQMSYNTFIRERKYEHADGNSVTFLRTNNISERFKFLFCYVNVSDWLDIFSRSLTAGISYWGSIITGKPLDYCDEDNRGWHRVMSNNITIPDEQVADTLDSEELDINFREERIDEVYNLISLCKSHQIDVYLMFQPLSNNMIWRSGNWDQLKTRIDDTFRGTDTHIIDYNLLKDRYILFFDSTSFKDDVHMSEVGARIFSQSFSDIFNKIKTNEPIDDLFYDTYEEMKKDSPYYQSITKQFN